MSVWTRGGGHYEVVLPLIVAIIALTPLDTGTSRPLIVLLLGLVFLFSYWTSGASKQTLVISSILVIAAVIVASAGQFGGGQSPRVAFTATGLAMCAAAITTIVAHLAAQRRVTRRMVTGAISVYLMIGLLFANVFALIGAVTSNDFFAQPGAHGATDYVYFSYITLTTVGYGDLTAGSSFGRIMAVLDALIGQLYLVTIVALVVANIGRERDAKQLRPRARGRRARTSPPDEGSADDAESSAPDVSGDDDPRIARDE
jgi:ion channel